MFTLPETNSFAPENGWLEDEFPLGAMLAFWEGRSLRYDYLSSCLLQLRCNVSLCGDKICENPESFSSFKELKETNPFLLVMVDKILPNASTHKNGFFLKPRLPCPFEASVGTLGYPFDAGSRVTVWNEVFIQIIFGDTPSGKKLHGNQLIW